MGHFGATLGRGRVNSPPRELVFKGFGGLEGLLLSECIYTPGGQRPRRINLSSLYDSAGTPCPWTYDGVETRDYSAGTPCPGKQMTMCRFPKQQGCRTVFVSKRMTILLSMSVPADSWSPKSEGGKIPSLLIYDIIFIRN